MRRSSSSGAVITVSVDRGEGSLDFCGKCLAEWLAQIACRVAPEGVSYKYVNEGAR